jgi:predicted TIM-barrel fold metal-dependent hydrolase
VIIDAHCHAGKGDGLTGPWDTDAALGRYMRRARRAGIERTLLLPAFHSNYREANRRLAAIVASDPTRLFAFAMVNAARDAGNVAALVGEAVRELGFCGIKLHRHDARITREVCEVARAFRLPVLYDVMGETSSVELFASEYRDVRFIIPHLGSFADDWRAHTALIDQLVRFPNVYADTAGVRRFDYLVEAVRRAGPRKLIYGSDGPWLHPGLELTKIKLLGLRPDDERAVLGGNIAALLTPAPLRPSAPPAVAAAAPSTPPRDPWAAAPHAST